MIPQPRLAVIWIDWYAYHVARFQALAEHVAFRGRATGIELVGGEGVHAGLRFRHLGRDRLPITTVLPGADWSRTSQWRLGILVWRRLSELRPSLLMVPGYYTIPAVMAAVWGRLHRIRTVLMSESTREDHARSRWKERVKGLIIRALFDYAVVGGTRHRDYLEHLGFDTSKIALRYNVVDNSFFASGVRALRSAGRPPDFHAPARYFVYVGRLAPEKNVGRLLESFARYRAAGGHWGLVLVGDGPCRASLADLSARLGVAADVTFAGHRSTEELLPFYAFASAFVLPSLREPWGLVVNEAMASALPVLVSRLCGAADDVVVQGENGFTFDPRSPEELTELMLRLSRMGDASLLAMGQRSSKVIEEFSPARWASEVARIAEA